MKLIATTVIRNSAIGLETINGRIIEIDWDSQTVIRQMPVPLPKHPLSDDNPRGGLRGGRGVKRWNNQYYIANYDTVFVYDLDWTLRNEISHPLSVDIHEIDVDDNGVWLSCSKYDLVLKLDHSGNLLSKWHITDSPQLMKTLCIDADPIDYDRDYRVLAPKGMDRTHLNCVQIIDNDLITVHLGQVYPNTLSRRIIRKLIGTPGPKAQHFSRLKRRIYELLLGSRSFIVKINLKNVGSPQILAHYPALRPNHNGQVIADKTHVILAESHEVVTCDAAATWCRTPIEGTWFRGFAPLTNGHALVGVAPCAIIEVDLAAGCAQRKLLLSENPNEAIHGLAVVG